jgi:hypothetical protein
VLDIASKYTIDTHRTPFIEVLKASAIVGSAILTIETSNALIKVPIEVIGKITRRGT